MPICLELGGLLNTADSSLPKLQPLLTVVVGVLWHLASTGVRLFQKTD